MSEILMVILAVCWLSVAAIYCYRAGYRRGFMIGSSNHPSVKRDLFRREP